MTWSLVKFKEPALSPRIKKLLKRVAKTAGIKYKTVKTMYIALPNKHRPELLRAMRQELSASRPATLTTKQLHDLDANTLEYAS